ncbi:MAG: UDP-N-acetylmuramate dehydrogenase [Bdellovibrionales bacterium]|nr:UDP-N-acetylmuramate dehydrogenase [Bdellovibrionales bacterium]
MRRDCPLAPWVAYRVGGPADLLLESSQENEIVFALEQARHHQLPVTLLGNGTNLLVRDGGLRGLVIYMGQRSHGLDDGIQVYEETADFVRLHVPAHCAKARLLEYALENAYSGLEFSAGIPGSIGGAVYMNAGTKWGAYNEVIETVRLYSPSKGIFEKSVADMGFTYRGHGEGVLDGETVVLSVVIKLRRDKRAAQIRALVDEILTYRGSKQPLELPNCGSVFKNPANSELGAGRLIEACGLKGKRVGDAQVSLKHANFILNLGKARAADIEALIREIQRTVLEVKGVALETEVIMMGEA